MKGYARTIIGVHEHQMLTIVEYPSPAVFAAMGKSDAYAKRNQQLRLAGLERQLMMMLLIFTLTRQSRRVILTRTGNMPLNAPTERMEA